MDFVFALTVTVYAYLRVALQYGGGCADGGARSSFLSGLCDAGLHADARLKGIIVCMHIC
jgi:hypothetical protein